MASTQEVGGLNTQPRWHNKVTRQSPHITLRLARRFKSHIIYPRGARWQCPGLERDNYFFRLSPDKEGRCLEHPTTANSGEPHSGERDAKLSPVKSLFQMSGWCLCHLTGSPEPTNKGKERFPCVVVKDTDTQTRIWTCALVDPRALRHRPLDAAGNAHAQPAGQARHTFIGEDIFQVEI